VTAAAASTGMLGAAFEATFQSLARQGQRGSLPLLESLLKFSAEGGDTSSPPEFGPGGLDICVAALYEHDEQFIGGMKGLLTHEKDIVKAIEWWTKAAEKGSAAAQVRLAKWYLWEIEVGKHDYLQYEHFVALAALNTPIGDKQYDAKITDALENHTSNITTKREGLKVIRDMYGLNMGDDVVEAFAAPMTCAPPHAAVNLTHHIAKCFMNGIYGIKKNLQISKDYLKLSAKLKGTKKYVEADLERLRGCAKCGGTGAWACALCKVTRYCSKECQEWHWFNGDEPHREHCPRAETPSKYAELKKITAFDLQITSFA
jgi:TPR repeat protein